MNRLINSPIIAGFECGQLVWNGHDLLETTRHTPGTDMRAHYQAAIAHGIKTCRDGLRPDGMNFYRMQIAAECGMQVIWDLNHFNRMPQHPEAFAQSVVLDHLRAEGGKPLWICPVNEPAMVPMMQTNTTRDAAIVWGLRALYVIRRMYENVKVMTCDPIVSSATGPWDGTDAFNEQATVIGLNIYPHTMVDPISVVIMAAHFRYGGKPIMISETSWHDGYHRRDGVNNKAEWLAHVEDEVELARQQGANVVGICWYPFVDSPPWDNPGADERWSHGLIRHNGSFDPVLSQALKRRSGRD